MSVPQQIIPTYFLLLKFEIVLLNSLKVINNACATQAILSILLNTPELDMGEELTNFKTFTQDFPPELKGLAISNSEAIRAAHNSFARPEPFSVGEEVSRGEEEEDIYHFISYLPFQGAVWELDGLKKGPINLGACEPSQWVERAFPHIQERIQRYAASEIRFNLLAVIRNRKVVFQERLETLQLALQNLQNASDSSMDIEGSGPSSPEEREAMIQTTREEIREVEHNIAMEEEKFNRWKVENIRRKHNYIPFFVNLLKLLAEKGELGPLIQKAQKRA